MRLLFKLRPLHSDSGSILLHFRVNRLQLFRFSTMSKSSKLQNPKKTGETHRNNQKETKDFGALFNEITEILGTENLSKDNPASRCSFSNADSHLENFQTREELCTQAVCENATEGLDLGKEESPCLEGSQLANSRESDVSPVVHRVTEIVRGENSAIQMEKRLEKLVSEPSLEVVDKVLKRCFKVPQLALRFFNWVKVRNGFFHNTQTYNTMIYVAGEAKEFRLVEELVEEMERSTCEKDIKTWTILISHYGKAKLIGKALVVFEKMKKSGLEPDVKAYASMLRLLCNAGKSDLVLEFYKEMVQKEIVLDKNLYKLLLKSLARCGRIDAVHLVADDMIQVSEIPEQDAYASVLKSFCISGRITEALELIRDLKNNSINLDPESFEILVKGLCRADRIADALEILDIMKKRTVADEKIHGLIINGYLRRNDVSKALEVFQSIKKLGFLPTISTYTELIQHLIGYGEFQKASELYNEMLEKGLALDSVAITAMVAGHVRQNHVSEAWEMFKSMKEKGIKATPKCYTIFMKELSKLSKMDEIIKVLNEMQASDIIIGDDIFLCVISYLEKKDELKKVEIVKEMQKACKLYPQGETPTSDISSRHKLILRLKAKDVGQFRVDSLKSYSKDDLEEICRILSSSMDWDLKHEALEKCSVQFTPKLVVEILRNCRVHSGAALHFFSWVGKQAGYSHTSDTYNMAIKISGCGKDFEHMRSLFYEMKRKGCLITSDTWTIMIMQYGRIGLTEIALRNFREMKASGHTPTGSTYKYLIISLCGKKGRKVDEAVQTFQEMIRMGCIPDKELVETYFGCLSEAGKLLDARNSAESLCKVGFTIPLTYSLHCRALCRAGRLEEALALADEVGGDRQTLDHYTYGSLVHGLLRRGRLEEALTKIELMKEVGENPTVHVYTSLIVYYFKEKKIDKALEIFHQMKEQGCEPTIVTYSALIRGYMTMGKVMDAWDVFHDMKRKGPFPDFKTYSMFISSLCKVGKSEEALQLVSEMSNSGIVPSTVNFRTVYYGLNREGKQHLAHNVLQRKWDATSRRKFLT
ncbi:hypothetical protein RJ639_045782 [Escallonia herrerae]|uniref:Pentatricopeptide repeat-containing protein-mitochondrial domain-containing protein n=1 Tax=Escallonia herrerae TaxID=1293975 RepID=A0AA89AZR0_9ASTE|nr:hypothetical protein RJ639_045782 [Escallonia herrerae]